jgi:hypothetical protein
MSVEAYAAAADAYLRQAQHPTLGGDRDFMRPITGEVYGIPAECVVGSSATPRYQHLTRNR